MKLARLETFPVPPRWLFVRAETSDGNVGWGEASLEGHTEAVQGAFEALRDRFIGYDPARIEDIWQVAHRGGFYRGGPVLMSALSGLDQCLWDIKGKALGQPVWQLLGGKVREKIKAYAWIGGDEPSEVGEAARARRKQGFSAVKMNATAKMSMLESPSACDAVLARIEAVKDEDLDVAIDFHGRVRGPMARQLIRAIEPARPLFIEEPLLGEHPAAIAALRRFTALPIALGERLYSRWDFRPFLELGAVDIVQPDVAHAGGISEVRRIAALAEIYDVAVAPHCPLGPLALASCLQLAAITPNYAIQEMSLGIHYNRGADLLSFVENKDALTPSEGHLPIPEEPGVGIRIDEAAVREAAKTPHRWRNPVWRGDDGGFEEW